MAVYGLTGGIASGKSCVSRRLAELGAIIIDADKISHEIMRFDRGAVSAVRKAFGNGVITPHGDIDRRALGALVFADKSKLELLNSIMHPLITDAVLSELAKAKKSGAIVIVDAPLLIQAGLDKHTDGVIVVYADVENRVKRIIKRDNISDARARERIASQESDDFLLSHASFALENNGSLDELIKKTDGLYALLMEKAVNNDE